LDLETIYPEDFLPVHEKILSRLETPKDKGLVILHGDPGTGKTTYIRYLIGLLKKRKIFVSPNMTSFISTPDFIKSLQERTDSVLIIEDAESILMSREAGGNDAVSNLLNLCDGLLADCFNIQVICTFNTKLENIDSALLRKGRLIARYEFPKLTKERAEAIAQQLGTDGTKLKEGSSLA
jgi:SpoVK/Ycf46/Vps4 family AAA+-type ATPase